MTAPHCACGLPLHYSSSRLRAAVDGRIASHEPDVVVTAPHGMKAAELPALGRRVH